jgi:hypothetical protein
MSAFSLLPRVAALRIITPCLTLFAFLLVAGQSGPASAVPVTVALTDISNTLVEVVPLAAVGANKTLTLQLVLDPPPGDVAADITIQIDHSVAGTPSSATFTSLTSLNGYSLPGSHDYLGLNGTHPSLDLYDTVTWFVNLGPLAGDVSIKSQINFFGRNLDGPIGANLTYDVIDTPNATPLPGALPLFASGLGALGLIHWRRRRRTQVV